MVRLSDLLKWKKNLIELYAYSLKIFVLNISELYLQAVFIEWETVEDGGHFSLLLNILFPIILGKVEKCVLACLISVIIQVRMALLASVTSANKHSSWL